MLPGLRHSYQPENDYISWIRADYFCKYLLGDFDQSVDMWEINRERPQGSGKPAVQQQQERRRAN